MNPASWNNLKELFGTAIELDSDQRSAYLLEVCGTDEALRAELESLLAAYDSEKSSADYALPGRFTAGAVTGDRIGPYQVIRQIGAGGMGAVYLAVRADDTFRKNVAIKVVQGVAGTAEILQRFRAERQILATFDHVNIAKLLDGGVTHQGLPYFAMDYIEGVRIDEYCETRSLPVNERITLFLQVCSAVQYVHQNLVVHRDLKPSNIMVTPNGVVKLLDFGIAKLVKPEMFADVTRAEYRPMTLGYASPEQIRGDPITTASDIYSLGVLLYLLLTSRSPYRLKTDSPHEMMLAVCEQEPGAPSAVVVGKLQRQLRGDLDNIVLQAIRKDPNRRYAAAEQLADDLRRYLVGLPVTAHRDTWTYRAGKFMRRNKAGGAAAVLVLVSLTTGTVLATWQAGVATRERANAQQQFNDVRKLTTSLLFEFHNAIQNLPGSTPARKLLVHRALEYLSRLAKGTHGDAGLERELAEAYLKVGDVQGNPYSANVGDTNGAQQSYSQALLISQALLQANRNDSLARVYLARSHKGLGQVLPLLGRPSQAAAHFHEAAVGLEALAASDPGNEELREELATLYQVRGDLEGHSGLQNLGDPAAALESYRKALRIYQDQAVRDPSSRKVKLGLELVRLRIADVEVSQRGWKRGLDEYRRILATLETLLAADPANANALHLVAVGYRKVGGALEELGEMKPALQNYDKATSLNETLLNGDSGNAQAAMALAITLRYAGDLLAKTGDYRAALPKYEKVLGILDGLAAAQPDNVLVQSRRAETLLYQSAAMTQTGDPLKARQFTTRALAITRGLAARSDATSDELFDYATSFLDCTPADLREPATALDYAKQSVQKPGGQNSETLDLLARAYSRTGDFARAMETEKQALQLLPAEQGNGTGSTLRRKLSARLAKYKASAGI